MQGKVKLFLLFLLILGSVVFYKYSDYIFEVINEYVYDRQVAKLSRIKKDFIESEDVVAIKLKSGGNLTGVIKNKTGKGMTVDLGYGTVSVSNSDVESIYDPTDTGKKTVLIQKWKSKIFTGTEKEKDQLLKRTLDSVIHQFKWADAEKLSKTEIPFKDPSAIVVNTVLNNREKTKLLLDTGASLVIISPRLARHMGIDYLNKQTYTFTLADQNQVQGVPIMLKSVRVGGVEEKNVKAAILLNQNDFNDDYEGLLGLSFLRNFHIMIDNERNVIRLEGK